MRSRFAGLAASLCLASSPASAQEPSSPKPDPVPLEKPKPPIKPVAPSTRTASVQPKPAGQAGMFVSDLQGLSPEARIFATARLSAITPALRVQAASRVSGKAVGLNDIPQTWLATAGSPAGAKLWLGGKDVDLVTGPDVEPMFEVAAAERNDRGIWVQFNAEAGVSHLLLCDMTGPARWDLLVGSKMRTPMIRDADTRGIALIPANQTKTYQRVLLVLSRPLETGPGSALAEGLRRCEVTPIRS